MTEDIIYREIDLTVFYDYQPYEPPEYYDTNGTGYPGCSASIDINDVEHKGESIIELLDGAQLNDIEELLNP